MGFGVSGEWCWEMVLGSCIWEWHLWECLGMGFLGMTGNPFSYKHPSETMNQMTPILSLERVVNHNWGGVFGSLF